jgi:hypothetical protein
MKQVPRNLFDAARKADPYAAGAVIETYRAGGMDYDTMTVVLKKIAAEAGQ